MMTGFPRSGDAVETAFIRAIFYEVNAARLFVSFANGRTYAYNNVPAAVHRAFQGALSPDMYFTLNIPATNIRFERCWGTGACRGA